MVTIPRQRRQRSGRSQIARLKCLRSAARTGRRDSSRRWPGNGDPEPDARPRQKATLAEELAHIVMGHPPSRIDATTGLRTYDGDIESEAYGVGGAMILPYSQLFSLVKAGTRAASIASRFSVSEAFLNYRINRTGLRRMYRKAVGA